jgi:hypothetical protein
MTAKRLARHLASAALLLFVLVPRAHAELRLAEVHMVVGHHGSMLFFRREGFDVVEGVLIADTTAKRLRFEAKGRSAFDVSFDRFGAVRDEESGFPRRAFEGPGRYLVVHYDLNGDDPAVAIFRLPSITRRQAIGTFLAALERDSGIHIERGPAATSFAGLPIHLSVGKKVRLTDRAGTTVKGRVSHVGLSSLDLGKAGRFDAAAVEQIEVSDPLWNGAIFGYLIGGVAATAVVFATCFECTFKQQDVIGYGFIAAGVAAGVAIDLNAMRKAYHRSNQNDAPRVEWQPIVGRIRQGMQVSVRF